MTRVDSTMTVAGSNMARRRAPVVSMPHRAPARSHPFRRNGVAEVDLAEVDLAEVDLAEVDTAAVDTAAAAGAEITSCLAGMQSDVCRP